MDLSRARLWPSSPSRRVQEIDGEALLDLDDVVYLPVVRQSASETRLRLAESMKDEGVPIVLQLLPGESAPGFKGGIYDLLEPLLDRDLDSLHQLPAGASAVWPLISGYSDDQEQCRRGLTILARSGVDAVQGVALDLSPAHRRRIVERGGDDGFDRLFHGGSPSERDFSRLVDRAGMNPFIERLVPERPSRLRDNRRLAAVLYRYADMWIRLGKPEARAQEIYATARRIDVEAHDLREIGQEGNLNIVDWLGPRARRVVEEWIASGRSTRLEALIREYLAP